MSPDLVNASFEFIGAAVLTLNIYRILKDKSVAGVSVAPTIFYSSWGLWNLYYYPHLGQTWSGTAAVWVFIANATWVILALHYRAKESK